MISQATQSETMPFTCLRWKPSIDNKVSSTLVTTCSEGAIQHWQLNSGKCFHTIREEPNNNFFCLDFHPNGKQFAAAGMDCHIYLYDETTRQRTQKMKEGLKNQVGHSNRVFVVKFHPQDHNILLSGGWDNTIQIYDLR